MNYNDLITVYTLNDPYHAEVIRTSLRGYGIPCELDGAGQAGLADILEIGILVRACDADRARKIIRSAEGRSAREPHLRRSD